MSEVFEEYDREIRELFAKLSRKCTSARVLVEDEKKLIVSEIAGEIDEAEDMMRKMELEARSMTTDMKDKVIVKLGEYRNELKKLKSEVTRLRESNANQATRPALLRSGDIRPVQGSVDRRGRLVTSSSKLNKLNESIREDRRWPRAVEFSDLVLKYLDRQLGTLKQADTTVRRGVNKVDRSKRSSSGMSKGMN